MEDRKLSENDKIVIPAMEMPEFRTALAIKRGVEQNLLFKTWGGLGDQICAEPTLRFALKTFKDCKVSLASEHPELFTHLNFKKVYDLKKEKPDYTEYLVFNTIVPPTSLVWQFFGHMITNCVDFPSMCALRCQLPVADRSVILKPQTPISLDLPKNSVYVHAGRHWPSKTFPKWWWDKVLDTLCENDVVPVLIGADTDDNRGTVDVDSHGCIDLRNKLSINDSIAYLQRAKVLLTNDSSPLHMAVSGDAWIGYIATCKHPDFITHWRKGQWSWRMQNHGVSGIWDVMDYCPNKKSEITVDQIDEKLLLSWLPKPEDFAMWGVKKLYE